MSIAHPIPIPEDNSFTELESLYIQAVVHDELFSLTILSSKPGIDPLGNSDIMRRRLAFLVLGSTSKAVHYATLAYAAFHYDTASPHATLQYLDRCYRHLQEAVSDSALIEILYASCLCFGTGD